MKHRNGMPIIGTKAEAFKAITPEGLIKKSSDFSNKWIILFNTPVGAKEFMHFWKANEEFEKLDAYLVESQKASDLSNAREISFIDPRGVVRTVIYTSLAIDIDFEEIKRTLLGFQAVEEYGIGLPTDWYPGEEVVLHKESPCPVAKTRLNDTVKMYLH